MNARLVSIVFLAAALLVAKLPGSADVAGKPEKRLSTFPIEMDGWSGKDDPFDKEVMRVVATDDDLHREYRKADAMLWLYVGYYGTRKGGRTGHLPHHCYPAAGYRIVKLDKVPVERGDGRTVQVNHIVLERKGRVTSALYWIHSGEHQVLSSGWAMNFSRLRRRLTEGRDDGALVRISAPVTGSVEATVEQQRSFAKDFLDRIPDHWPLESSAENLQRFALLSGKSEES